MLIICGSYTANMQLAGVIYLHEIVQPRMLAVSQKNLDMFAKLCGQQATKTIIFVTTKWSAVRKDVGKTREDALKCNDFKEMIALGARLRRFEDSQESGWQIIREILQYADTTDIYATNDLEIQRELVEMNKLVSDTTAGRTLRFKLKDLLESQRRAEALLLEDEDDHKFKKALEENEKKIHTILQQLMALIPSWRVPDGLRKLLVSAGPSCTFRQRMTFSVSS